MCALVMPYLQIKTFTQPKTDNLTKMFGSVNN